MGRPGPGVGNDDEGVIVLQRAIDRYLAARRPALAKRSVREIGYVLDRFARHIGPDVAIRRLERRHVEEWFASRTAVAPNTRNHELSVVRNFTGWCADHDLIRRDPCRGLKGGRLPQAPPREIKDDAEILSLLTALPDTRAFVIVGLMLMEGLRVSEVVGIEMADIDFDDRLVLVHGKGSKDRLVPISDETLEALDQYLAEHPAKSGHLVRSYRDGSNLTYGHVSKLVSTWMSDAGIKAQPRDGRSAHALRHTALGALVDGGADLREVQAIAGHSSLASTYRYLLRRQAMSQLRAAMNKRRGYRQGPVPCPQLSA